MPTNYFLPFSTDPAANVLSDTEWSALSSRATGLQSGIAPSKVFNKAFRQSTFNAAMLGAFVVDQAQVDALDDGNLTNYLGNYKLALKNYVASFARVKLLANISLYVTTTGNDTTGNGSATAPWASLQRAWNYIVVNLDLNGFNVTVNVAAGTYTQGLVASGVVLGLGSGNSILFQGSGMTTCNINTTNAFCMYIANGAAMNFGGFRFTAAGTVGPTAVACVNVTSGATAAMTSPCDYGTANIAHLWVQDAIFGNNYNTNYTISGGAGTHILCNPFGTVVFGAASLPFTTTIVGTPTFSNAFVESFQGSLQHIAGTFVGGCIGPKFLVDNWGLIVTNGAGANYFPGNSAGTATSSGKYA